MSLYVISDLHLSLGCCTKKPMNIFSPRWTDHTVKLKSAWNSIVGIGDTVIVGGDISWAMTLDEAKEDLLFLDSLNGTKILLEGNHDFWWQSISKTVGFIKSLGISSIHLLQNNAYRLDGEKTVICGTRGWYTDKDDAPNGTDYQKMLSREAQRLSLSVSSARDIALDGDEIIAVTHFPLVHDFFIFKDAIGILSENGIRKCYYGHIHGEYNSPPKRVYNGIEFILTSSDYLNFIPLKIH